MKDEIIYMVFRVYSEEERPYDEPSKRVVFYGWSTEKSVIKAFTQQRTKTKYKVAKVDDETIANHYGENFRDLSNMIDFVSLKFASTGEQISFFTTQNELKEIEIKIQRHFKELCSLVEKDNGNLTLLTLYMNLDEYYASALEYIGFVPDDLEYLFPPAEYDDIDSIEDTIESAYDGMYEYPHDESHQMNIQGKNLLDSYARKVIYSVESFIKVLKNDL